jgi:hypothetical protein
MLGNGDGSFQSALNYGAGLKPFSVAIDDLNVDGAIDLAVVNWSSDNVSVLLGNGDGSFQSALNYGAGLKPFSVGRFKAFFCCNRRPEWRWPPGPGRGE